MIWQLQDAKNLFGALVKAAENEGPQMITVHGHEKVVMISAETYKRLMLRKESLLDVFQASPWAETDIDITRIGHAAWEDEL